MQLTLTGKQIRQLADMVDSDDDQILVTFTNQHEGHGLYATPSGAIPPEWTPLFDTEEADSGRVERAG